MMSKKLTAIWYFHKPLVGMGLFFSLFAVYLIITIGVAFTPYAIAIKIAGNCGYIFYKHHFANQTYLYFQNAGYSVVTMYIYSIGFDFAVFTFMLTIYFLAK